MLLLSLHQIFFKKESGTTYLFGVLLVAALLLLLPLPAPVPEMADESRLFFLRVEGIVFFGLLRFPLDGDYSCVNTELIGCSCGQLMDLDFWIIDLTFLPCCI